ncbi:MAG: class I SAM-dependent methyltransferase [Vicinamibacterales bacterium]
MTCAEYGVLAEFYDYVEPYRVRPDVGFYVDAARASGGPVLELGCGTGRILLPTARAGVEIVGVDLSPAMLARCAAHLADETAETRARVRLVQADMRRFHIRRRFALVTAPFRSVQHLMTVDAQLEALACVRDHLADGGRFVLDLFNPSLTYLADPRSVTVPASEPEFTMPDGRRVERSMRLASCDRVQQVIRPEMIYRIVQPNGLTEVIREEFSLRYLFRFEAEHLLARAGFAVEHLYGGFDRSAIGTTEPRELVFVARRA